MQVTKDIFCFSCVGGNVGGDDVHIKPLPHCPLLGIDLHAVNIGDFPLHRLDGLILIHAADMDTQQKIAVRIQQFRKNPVIHFRGGDLQEGSGAVFCAHLEPPSRTEPKRGWLPYILFGYLCNKVAQGLGLAPGQNLSERLLAIGDGMLAAFSRPLPSMSSANLLIGIAGALFLRLAVYTRSQNAKKYRHGVEYGSARWGTPADIAPFIDPDFFQNIPMTMTERLTMESRPKQPKYARNKNILVIGGSGSGKTRFFCKPSLLQAHSSYPSLFKRLLKGHN